MILGANLFVLIARPRSLTVFYVGLVLSLLASAIVPMDAFLGLPRQQQVVLSCLVAFAPILFAGVVFAVSFGRTASPDRAFGLNVAGAVLTAHITKEGELVSVSSTFISDLEQAANQGTPDRAALGAIPAITATGNRIQWLDDGPPKTESKPGLIGQRFYRLFESCP